jgi:5,10-methylenetetrahydrofolate reductase
MKIISSVLRNSNHAATTLPVQHLTTRLSLHDTYNELLDARRLGIEYLLPVLGEPRGPKVSGFFNNSLDLLTFAKNVTNPDLCSSLSNQVPSLKKIDIPYIEDVNFIVGSVIDPNEFKESANGTKRRIRKQQIELFHKRRDIGADYFITQGLFDPLQFLEFKDEIDCKDIPIGVGVIPPSLTIAKVTGIPIPKEIRFRLKQKVSKKQQFQVALQIAHENYCTLRENGVPWIHVYSLSRYDVFQMITGGNPTEKGSPTQMAQILDKSKPPISLDLPHKSNI